MTTTQVLPARAVRTSPEPDVQATEAARISFRQPVSTTGFIDAAWWPRSLALTEELPALLDVLWTSAREINRVTYTISAWDPAPRKLTVQGRNVRLGGFTSSDPLTIRLSDAWGAERIDILVIAPTTDPAIAQRAMELASEGDDLCRAGEIMARASAGTTAGSGS
jgi:Family of unknown function (DUF5994)